MKDGAYVINPDYKQSKIAHQVILFFDGNAAVYFDTFEVKFIPQEVFGKIKKIHKATYLDDDDDYVV